MDQFSSHPFEDANNALKEEGPDIATPVNLAEEPKSSKQTLPDITALPKSDDNDDNDDKDDKDDPSKNQESTFRGGDDGDDKSGSTGGTGGGTSGQPEVVIFTNIRDSPAYYSANETQTITYKVNGTVELTQVLWMARRASSIEIISKATFDDNNNQEAESDDPFGDVNRKGAALELDDNALAEYYGVPMRLEVVWESEWASGKTKTPYFGISSDNNRRLEVESNVEIANAAEGDLEEISYKEEAPRESEVPVQTNSNVADQKEESDGGGSGGLSTGAKAGIAVGAVLGGLLIIGLAWFLLRRRRRNKKLGSDYAGQQAYVMDKETHGRATDSPNSPYSVENQVQPVSMANIDRSQDDTFEPAPPRTSAGSRGRASGTQTPQGVSSNVAHLVEDGMTAAEIQRLEEEERQLDAEIERAARR